MVEATHRAKDVYGVGRELPMNYVTRRSVDDVFVENLTRDKHIVVYGSSKQGKTSLRKNWLKDDDHIILSCLNTMALEELNAAILKGVGYRLEQSTIRTASGALKVNAEFAGKGKVPFVAEASGKGAIEKQDSTSSSTTTVRLELDLKDVNDVIAALKEINFDRYIILEDFHYLPIETQRNFAFALKAFHENSKICFIVIGVWREKNRLIYYNGDLNGRVVSIDADEWTREELREVISSGEALLNISFDASFVDSVLDNSFDAVYLVQEACLRACETQKIYNTQETHTSVGAGMDAKSIVKSIVDEQAGRYAAFLTNFSEGFQKTGLEMYKWLLRAVISSDRTDLEKGMRRSAVGALIKRFHPDGEGLNEGNITQALQNAASLQVTKHIRPLILDYDQTTRILNIVDRSFLIWLAHQNVEDLIEQIDMV